MISSFLQSSIGKKQVVAGTGLALILFLIAHLSANILVFWGPEALNGYSEFLHSHTMFLMIARLGLLATFVVHIAMTIIVVIENRRARKSRYQVHQLAVKKGLIVRLMPVSGLVLLVYLGTHLLDFTFNGPTEMNAIVDGRFQGMYGLMVNAFVSPIRLGWYIIAMIAVGMHLVHAFESVFQTFGFHHARYTPIIRVFSLWFGIAIAIAFSSVAIYLHFVGVQAMGG